MTTQRRQQNTLLSFIVALMMAATFVTRHASGQSARGITPEEAAAKRLLGPGDGLIAQVATGTVPGGAFFFTQLEAVNVTDATATYTILFGDDQGNALTFPLIGPGGTPAGEFSGVTDTLPAGAGSGALTDFNSDVHVGYAVVTSDPPGSVAVTGIFNNQVPGSRLFQASMAPDIITHSRLRTIFSGGLGGYVSSLAVVSFFAQTVTLTARDQLAGVVLCSAPLFIPQAGHSAFIVRQSLPCANGRQGILEVVAPMGGIGGVGFLAADQGLGRSRHCPFSGTERGEIFGSEGFH